MTNLKNKIPHKPVKLLKNISYQTYQLYAEVDNKKTDVETALKIAILETMSWLRQRFREIEAPPEINYPEPEDYLSFSEDHFRSFKTTNGYVVEVLSIVEKGIWAFQLIEPDLGPDPGNDEQEKKPVPGRIFETNIAFKIVGNKLECGFKTICSEPVGTKTICDVFRISVAKNMARNKKLGLRQVYPIIEEAHIINSRDRVKQIKDFANNTDRQLPLILFSEYILKQDKYETLQKEIFNKEFSYTDRITNRFYLLDDVELINNKNAKIPFDVENFVKYKMGLAQFAFIKYDNIDNFNEIFGKEYSITPGSVRIIHPCNLKIRSEYYSYDEIFKDPTLLRGIENKIRKYPKNKSINFGNVKFINDAYFEKKQINLSAKNSKEEIIQTYEENIESLKKLYEKKANELTDQIINRDEKITRREEKITSLKQTLKEIEKERDNLLSQIDEKQELYKKLIDRQKWLKKRPETNAEVEKWVNNNFYNKLIFHEKAKNLMKALPPNDVDLNLLCDAIESLAIEYRDKLTGKINHTTYQELCAIKYDRSFIVTPSGDKSIKEYKSEYKVKYKFANKEKSEEVPLDYHLKVGVDSVYLIRIYFFYDKYEKLIVVGSLPKHLSTS